MINWDSTIIMVHDLKVSSNQKLKIKAFSKNYLPFTKTFHSLGNIFDLKFNHVISNVFVKCVNSL